MAFDPASAFAWDFGDTGAGNGAGVTYGGTPMGYAGYFSDPNRTNAAGGALSGSPAGGPLSGLWGGSLGGAGSNFWNSGVPAALGGSILAGRGVLSTGLANFGAQAPQVIQAAQRRMALNKWLIAQSQGGQIDPATMSLLQSDPQLAENIAAARLTPHRQWSEIGEDVYGRKQFGFVDPFNQTVTGSGGAPAAVPGAGGGGASAGGGSETPTYDSLPSSGKAQADAIVDGRMAPLSGRSLITPVGAAIMGAVAEKDPSYDATKFPARQALRQSFTSGDDAKTITAGNTAIGHLNELDATVEKLPTAAWAPGQPFAAYYETLGRVAAAKGTGSPEAQALAAFESARQKYSAEATKFYAGTGGGEGDREEAERAFDTAKSPAELHAAANAQADLLQSKVQALQSKWHQGMDSPARPAADFPIISPESQAALGQVRQRYQKASRSGAAQEGQTATNPKTGHRIVMKGGQWLDAQTGQPVQ